VDLIITDPPYTSLDVYFKSFKGKRLALDDPDHWFDTLSDVVIVQLLKRLKRRYLKDTGALYCFADVKTGLQIFPPLNPRNVIVWDKVRIGMGGQWRRMHEWIAYCPKSKHVLQHGTELGDIIRCSTPKNKQHPTEKPPGVILPLLRNSSASVDDVVFDPFLGGGNVLYTAKALGRKAIGCDIKEKWCEVAASTLARGLREEDILVGRQHVVNVAPGFGF